VVEWCVEKNAPQNGISDNRSLKGQREKKGKNEKEEVKKRGLGWDNLPKEIRNKLPKGMKVKKMVVISPRNVMRWILYLLLGFYFLGIIVTLVGPEVSEVSLSEAIGDIKEGRVESIKVVGDKISLELIDEAGIVTTEKETTVSFAELLTNEEIDPSSVNFEVDNMSGWKTFGTVVLNLLSIGLPILFIYFIFKQASRAQGGMFSFGKSRAKLFVKGKQKITFKDVAGVEEAKEELEEVVDFLKRPEKYRKMGARIPKGVLLVGPSGVGKTLLARAVAGEAGVSFFSMAGSEFMEMLVGVGASRVRDLFATAKKTKRAIIFIDEIDAIGRSRGYGVGGGHDEREQTLNQILVEMDGFEANTNVIVLAATNRGDLLDSALLRPGRFDRRVMLDMPDIKDRQAIVKIHARGKKFSRTVNWEAVARRTVGFSGADIENMLNEAAILAARNEKKTIVFSDIEEAALKVKMGPRKKRVQTEMDKKITAYHEAGHAVVIHNLPGMDPVHRVSIVSRGMALGFTLIPPQKDVIHETKTKLLNQITGLMGGRVAEDMVFSEITTGAASDLQQASKIARMMVLEWGMSDLGLVSFNSSLSVENGGRSFRESLDVSDEVRAKIDAEVAKIIREARGKAKEVLVKNKGKLDKVAEKLLEIETLEQEEFEKLMN